MLELRRFDDRTELVSDDARGENGAVVDTLDGTDVGARWAAAPFEDGELVLEVSEADLKQIESLFAGDEDNGYLYGDVLAEIDEVLHGD
jgi:hypothetical protein